jgi:signal transduction histidine kinase
MLQGGYAGDLSERGGEYVAAIIEAVRRLDGQVDQVLAIAERDAGVGRAGEVDFSALLRSICERYEIAGNVPDDIGTTATATAVIDAVTRVLDAIGGGAAQLNVTNGKGLRIAIAGNAGGALPEEDVLIDLRAMMAEQHGSIAVARRAGEVPVVTLSFPR